MYRVITEGYEEFGHYFRKDDVVEKIAPINRDLADYRRVADDISQALEITDVEEINND